MANHNPSRIHTITDFNAENQNLLKEALTIIAVSEIPGALEEDENGTNITENVLGIAQLWTKTLKTPSYNTLLHQRKQLYEQRSLPQHAIQDYCQHMLTAAQPIPCTSDHTFYNRAFLTEFANIANQHRQTSEALAALATTQQATITVLDRIQETQAEHRRQQEEVQLRFSAVLNEASAIAARPAAAGGSAERSALDRVHVKSSSIGQFAPSAIPDPEAAWIFLESVH